MKRFYAIVTYKQEKETEIHTLSPNGDRRKRKYKAHFLITSISIMTLLMGLVLGVQLITVVIRISPIRLVIRVILISPVIKLLLGVCLSRHLFHSNAPF